MSIPCNYREYRGPTPNTNPIVLWSHNEQDSKYRVLIGETMRSLIFGFTEVHNPVFLWKHFQAASALNADNSDIEDDVAETTSADIGDCDLWVPEDEEEDKENEKEDDENVENKISDSEIEASGNSRRTNKAIC
ncbi:hypothetical protein FQA39_LY04781 [Lamprigera yunnana]|nr:hypothetical protein FQA39_LY04781 [Lamprigera yunnana]